MEETSNAGTPEGQGETLTPTPAEPPRKGGWFSRGWHYGVTAAVLVIVAGAFFAIGWFVSPGQDQPERAWMGETGQHLFPRERGFWRGGGDQPSHPQGMRPFRQQTPPSSQEAYLGVGLVTVDPQVQQRYDLSAATGALVVSVDRAGPAYQAGVRKGDVITGIDGSPVTTHEDVVETVLAKEPGDTLSITVNRDGQSLTFQVTLGRRAAATGGQSAG